MFDYEDDVVVVVVVDDVVVVVVDCYLYQYTRSDDTVLFGFPAFPLLFVVVAGLVTCGLQLSLLH